MSGPATAELVPIADRLRSVRWLRVALAATVVAAALGGVTPLEVSPVVLVAGTALYLVMLLGVEEVWRRLPRRGLLVVGATLLVDGLYLAWAGALTGGAAGIAPLLVLLHVVGVTLLVSYRTGVKIALWHALLIYAASQLHELGFLPLAGVGVEPWRWIVGYVAVVLLVTLGTASFSAVNERELRRRRADLEALAQLATELEQVGEPHAVAAVFAERLHDTFGFARVAILDRDGSKVLGTAGPTTGETTLPAAGAASVVRLVGVERRTRLVAALDAEADAGLAALLPDARNLLVVPLLASGQVLGVVVAEHGMRRGSRIERRVVETVERFCDHGALALRAAHLLDEVRALARVDALTGLANRRGFDETLPAEVSRATRLDEGLALLFLDIDHFGRVNKEHGVQAGDRVLRGVAEQLEKRSRDFDTVARYGGEEFVVIAPGCDRDAAAALAERLRAGVEGAALAVPVTISIGVALTPGHDTAESLIKAADACMQAAKRAGRNQVLIAED